ncbi:hypothetical protein FXW78_22450 [Rhodococcus opacus]|nr:hypothetical protein [Rhodococcus opacus]
MAKLFEDLFEYYDYVSAPIGNAIQRGGKDAENEFCTLLERYNEIAKVNPWSQLVNRTFPPSLPYSVQQIDQTGQRSTETFQDYNSVFDWYERQAREGHVAFVAFVEKYRTGPLEL